MWEMIEWYIRFKMEDSHIEKAGTLLGGLIENLGSEGKSIVDVFQNWKDIVQDIDIASHSSIQDIYNGTVYITVDHSAWMQLLQNKKAFVLQRMQQKYSNLHIQRIVIKIGELNRQSEVVRKKQEIKNTEKPKENKPSASLLESLERLQKAIDEHE